ncbi:MAG: Holliday junction branch migration protein RuvA, partial [Melioribacteraceae bacterium]
IELRDKVDSIAESFDKSFSGSFTVKNDAVAALTNLGYNQKNAEKIVRDILSGEPDISIEDLIKKALSEFFNK